MVKIPGTYRLERNENLDEYFKAVGVPYIPRKLMLASSPTMYVTNDKEDQDVWIFKTVSFIRTVELSFKLNESYEESMQNGDVFENVTTMEGDNKFITKSKSDEDDKAGFERVFEFSDDGLTITLRHSSGVEAKRYFKRT